MSTPNQNLSLPKSLQEFVDSSIRHAPFQATWANDFLVGDFRTALLAIEQEMSQANSSPRELSAVFNQKLGWVACEVQLGNVPLSALTAPLLEISEPLLTNDAVVELRSLACALFLKLGEKLLEKGQSRLAITLLEHGTDFSAAPGIMIGAQQSELNQFFLLALEEEITRAEKKRENKSYIDKLKKKHQIFSEKNFVEQNPINKKEIKQPRTRKPSLSSKALFEEAMLQDAPVSEPESSGDANAQASRESIHSEISGDHAEQLASKAAPYLRAHSRSDRTRLLFASLVILLLAIPSALFVLFRRGTNDTELALAMNIQIPLTVDAALPNIQPNQHEQLNQRINDLTTNLNQVGERLKSINSPNSESTSNPTPLQDPQVDQVALNSREADKLKSQKDDELVSIDGGKKAIPTVTAAPVDPRRTPRLDPNGLSQIPVEPVVEQPEVPGELPPHLRTNTGVIPNLRVGPDGRIYGPPTDKDPLSNTSQNAKALDGSPLRSYEVEQFPQPVLYKTITATNVLSAPSLLSTAISHLEADTSIHVTSKMGEWLELRSSAGRKGYIFSQDAIPSQP